MDSKGIARLFLNIHLHLEKYFGNLPQENKHNAEVNMILSPSTGMFGLFDEIFVSLFELYCFCVHNS